MSNSHLVFYNNIVGKDKSLELENSPEYCLRKSKKQDVHDITMLIRKSYMYWVDNGLRVNPAFQNEEHTKEHLSKGGFSLVFEDKIIGTFSLDEVAFSADDNSFSLTYFDKVIHYGTKLRNYDQFLNQKYLVFKKLAVDPAFNRRGVGSVLLKKAEQLGLENSYKGMVLETVKEAKWLYQWYLKEGYSVIGKKKYVPSKLFTHLLHKNFYS